MGDLQLFRGTVSRVGTTVDDIVQHAKAPVSASYTMPLHITIITKDEMRSLSSRRDEIVTSLSAIDASHLVCLGENSSHKQSAVRFLVVIWNAGQIFRKRFGLPPKQFHITLSEEDDHTLDKGIASLAVPFSSRLSSFTLDELDHIAHSLHQHGSPHDPTLPIQIASYMCLEYPSSTKGYLRLADASVRRDLHKQAMLSYARVLALDESSSGRLKNYCVHAMYQCSRYTEWGCIFTSDEWDQQIDPTLRSLLVVPWEDAVKDAIASYERPHVPTLCLESRERLSLPSSSSENPITLPRFFRWIVPFHFALMSTPRNAEDIQLLASDHIGIRHIITLTEETPLPAEWFQSGSRRPITHTFMPIPNYQAPSIEQMDIILRQFEDESKLPILVHCGGGKGRAGTIAACFIAAFGFAQADTSRAEPAMSATDAIASLRAIRPGSIETQQQEKFVHNWCSAVWKRGAVLPSLVSEPAPCDIEVVGDGNLKNSDLLMLVGLPGSGKSHFTRCLMARASSKAPWQHISQDLSGSRAFCETEIGRPGVSRAILDRCNASAEDRKYWLSLAATWARSPTCIWFDYDVELCTSRAQNRIGHPTLPPGGRVRAAVGSMKAAMQEPTLSEGFKSIVIVRSFEAANSLIRKLSPPIDLFKFPRTAHLLNLGSATDDDIIVDLPTFSEADAANLHLVITEKIDGANMGISLDADRRFVVQNRSHYIASNSHAQFGKLSHWLETPRISSALHEILGSDPYFPERYILFGEWMVATHSVSYTRLPDLFIAFDLYDRSLNRWATRDVLERTVGSRGISLVPVIERGPLKDVDLGRQRLLDMVQRQSLFYDGRIEGVYVKLERDGTLVQRGKVVRGDFIAGNDHWSKGIMRWNTFDRVE